MGRRLTRRLRRVNASPRDKPLPRQLEAPARLGFKRGEGAGVVDQALHTAGGWLELLIGLLLGVFGVIEGFCLLVLTAAHVPENLQHIVLIVVAALAIISILRLFGGVLRVLLTVFLLLLVLHVMLRVLGR